MNKAKYKLLPKITLEYIYGPNCVLNPRASFSKYGWLPDNPARLDFLTGAPLAISGAMPVICSHSVTTDCVISLLSKANLDVTPFRHIYRTPSDYQHILNLINEQKKKLIVNHLHPSTEIRHEDYWINPKIVAFLNHKSNLDYLIPSGYVPRRMTVPQTEISKALRTVNLPLVIKVATEQPAGGGCGVFICRSPRDVDYAYQHLRTCETVILEEYLEIEENYNIQYATTINGQIIYLGASEQLTDSAGFYYGNWLIKQQTPPQIVTDLGRTIMENASRLGYIGIAGMDIVVTKDNRILVIDLNFRLNGSTPALILQDSIFKAYKTSVLLFHNWKTQVKWNKFLSICSDAIKCYHLIPFSLYDPLSSPYSNNIYYFSGILVGTSREDVLKRQLILAKQGLW